MRAKELFDLTVDELLERSAGAQVGSTMAYAVEREFQRRAFVEAVEASKAQKMAADAAADTAHWTKISAISVAVSVAVMAIGIVIQAYVAGSGS